MIVIRKSINLKGKGDKFNLEKISEKHKVSLDKIEKQYSMGLKVELEHTKDLGIAAQIAIDHLTEMPDYYSKLAEMEGDMEKSISDSDKKKVDKFLAGYKGSMKDSDLHNFADSLGVSPHKIEEYIYSLAMAGMSKGIKDLSYWKKKLMSVLSGEKMGKSIDDLHRLAKGKAYPIGTKRTWNGKMYKKIAGGPTGKGKWMRSYSGKEDRGEKQAIRNVMKKIQNASSMEELSQIVSENMSRFKDDSGKTLPVVADFLSAARGNTVGEKKKEFDGPKATDPELARTRKVHEGRSLSINKMNLKEAKRDLEFENRPAMKEALKTGIKQLEEVIAEKEASQKYYDGRGDAYYGLGKEPRRIVKKTPKTVTIAIGNKDFTFKKDSRGFERGGSYLLSEPEDNGDKKGSPKEKLEGKIFQSDFPVTKDGKGKFAVAIGADTRNPVSEEDRKEFAKELIKEKMKEDDISPEDYTLDENSFKFERMGHTLRVEVNFSISDKLGEEINGKNLWNPKEAKKPETTAELDNRRMLKIIEALQTTHNKETVSYNHKTNDMLATHFEKINNAGTELEVTITGNGHIIQSFRGTVEEVKKELNLKEPEEKDPLEDNWTVEGANKELGLDKKDVAESIKKYKEKYPRRKLNVDKVYEIAILDESDRAKEMSMNESLSDKDRGELVRISRDLLSAKTFFQIKKLKSQFDEIKNNPKEPKKETGKKYTYGMNNRPAGPGAAPEGFGYDGTANDNFRHGTISYDRPLTEEELNKFEMTPVGGDHLDNVADFVVEKMGRYAKEYGKPENKEHFDSIVNQELMGVPYSKRVSQSDIDDLKQKIMDKISTPEAPKNTVPTSTKKVEDLKKLVSELAISERDPKTNTMSEKYYKTLNEFQTARNDLNELNRQNSEEYKKTDKYKEDQKVSEEKRKREYKRKERENSVTSTTYERAKKRTEKEVEGFVSGIKKSRIIIKDGRLLKVKG